MTLARFLSWSEQRNFVSVRSFVLYITLWMTWEAFQWAAAFAYAAKLDGLGTGAVIAAVTAPIAALQGFVFKIYSESRQ